jgi:hypothetical protein
VSAAPRLWPRDFEAPGEQPIHFARINVNGAIVRVLVTPEGRVKLLVPKSALDCGDVETWDDIDTGEHGMFGFASIQSEKQT